MKKTIILLTTIGLNSLSASTNSVESLNTNRVIDILVKHDLIIKREFPKSRDSRKSRESREVRSSRRTRESRQSRVIHLGRDSREVRQERDVRVVYSIHEKKKVPTPIASSSFIKKSYLSHLSK